MSNVPSVYAKSSSSSSHNYDWTAIRRRATDESRRMGVERRRIEVIEVESS